MRVGLLFLSILFWWHSAFAIHVVIDAGHGGTDRGATKGKIQEAQITLQVAKILEGYLNDDRRFEVSMTRRTDRFISLQERTRLADRKKGDLLLSIHVNSSPDPRAKGGEIYFQNQLPPDEESMFLASLENEGHGPINGSRPTYIPDPKLKHLRPDVRSIVEDLNRNSRLFLSAELSESLVKSWRGFRKSRKNTIRQAPFFVISNAHMPSALVELGFLSNKKESSRLRRTKYQEKLAHGIYEGLIKFKDFIDKTNYSGIN